MIMETELEHIKGFISKCADLERMLPLITSVAIIEYNGEDITGSMEIARHYEEHGYSVNAIKKIILCGKISNAILENENKLKKHFPSAKIEKTLCSWLQIKEKDLQVFDTLVFHMGIGARIFKSAVIEKRGYGNRFREIVKATHHTYCVCVLIISELDLFNPARYYIVGLSVSDFTLKDADKMPTLTSFCKEKKKYMEMCETTLAPKDIFFQCEAEAEHGCEECNQCNAYGRRKQCPMAQHKVAGFYRNGMFVPKDERIAHQWEVMAARQGYQPAVIQMADDLKDGIGCKQSVNAALDIYISLADKGDAYCVRQIIKIAEEHDEIEKIVAVPYIAKLAKSGNEDMMIKMSEAFQNGDFGLPIDRVQQEKWIRKGAENGNPRFVRAMAEMYESHSNWGNAYHWYKRLGEICPEAVSEEKLEEMEIKMLTKGALPKEIAHKGMDYLYGYHDTERDTHLAFKCLQYANGEGIALATGLLGEMFLNGVEVEKNIEKGISLLTDAAEKGDLLSIDKLIEISHDDEYEYKDDRWEDIVDDAINNGIKDENPIAWYLKGYYILINNGHEPMAFADMKTAAEMDYPKAQYRLAKMYECGCGTEQDKTLYLHWIKTAANNGHFEAEGEYGTHLYQSAGTWDYTRRASAFAYLERAFNQGYDEEKAYWCLARCYMFGHGTKIDKQKAYPMYIHAAEQGNADAQEKLCEDYFKGNEFLQKNYNECARWGEEAIKQGKKGVRFETAYSQSHTGNHERAKEIYLELANEGNGAAMNNYACELSDHKEKVEWFQKAVDAGDDYGMWNLGKFYRDGNGVEKDIDKALQLLNKAAEKGCIGAIKDLAWMYRYGYGSEIDKDGELAVKWYKKAVEKGDEYSIINLAEIYQEGEVVEKDMEMAIHYYKVGVEKGILKAMLKLGEIYEDGTSMEQNITKAIYWYRKAALKGNDQAKEHLRRLKTNWIEESGDDVSGEGNSFSVQK